MSFNLSSTYIKGFSSLGDQVYSNTSKNSRTMIKSIFDNSKSMIEQNKEKENLSEIMETKTDENQ
jgi:hypothetical protein